MNSIFDQIAAPTPSFMQDSSASQPVAPLVHMDNPGRVSASAPTGIVASVAPDEFEKIVRDTPGIVVLDTAATPGAAKPGMPRPPVARRYVAYANGIVFVCQSARAIDFPTRVQVIPCQAVIYEGRTLATNSAS